MLMVLPAKAVLIEDSLANSLAVLRHELVTYHREQDQMLANSSKLGEMVMLQLRDIMQRSAQNSLMLYSQKPDYVFDLAYACNEATNQYVEFKQKALPFRLFINKANTEIARYDSLIEVLSTMPVRMLSPQAKVDRNVCLTLAVNIRRMLADSQESLKEYNLFYTMTEQRLKALDNYANHRYQEIQESIFRNGGQNYFDILQHLNIGYLQTRMALAEKYTPSNKVRSQWDARWILWLFVSLIIYVVVALTLNVAVMRFVVSRLMRHERFKSFSNAFFKKRASITMATSVLTLAVILLVVKNLSSQYFVQMACSLLVYFTWLMAAILISLLLRVDDEKVESAFRVYSPLMVIGFVVFSFRIVLIPSVIVNLVFPPLLLLCTLWQINVLHRHRKNVPAYDMWLSSFSLVVFVFTLFAALLGYTLLSVQVLIWWIMQLTCILTIACFHDWLTRYRERNHYREKPVSKAWLFRLVYFVLMPVMLVFSFILSIYWAADVFNLSELTWRVFTTNYIDTENFRFSIFTLAQVIVLFFVFNYVNHTVRDVVKLHLERIDPTTAASRSVMFINVLQIVVWGAWLLIALAMFRVSNTWIVVVSGGLSTGIGFAMKDILENIYYGISLMAGRIKIGDYIICDGIRGKVSSISYTSTMVEAIDGSVIAFQNSQLFTKNYKNMTKNHGYELDILDVGVAYGTDISFAKKVLTEAIMKLKCVNHKRGVKIVLKSFDDSCIMLKVLIWVNVFTQYGDDGEVMECIYNTLNEHNIEIPFPQREVTIKGGPSPA